MMTPADIRALGAHLQAAPNLRRAAQAIRTEFPDLRITLVDALDMRGEVPYLLIGERALFLVESTGHCWHLTEQAELATGVILSGA